jgi:hypothetical protein
MGLVHWCLVVKASPHNREMMIEAWPSPGSTGSQIQTNIRASQSESIEMAPEDGIRMKYAITQNIHRDL